MKIPAIEEHLGCHHFDHTEVPAIEQIKIAKGDKGQLTASINEMVFLTEGSIKLVINDFVNYHATEGKILFLPAGDKLSFEGLADTKMIVLRIYNTIQLCNSFSLDELSSKVKQEQADTFGSGVLEINERIWHFLKGLDECLTDGIRCRGYFDLKIKEVFMMLRIYYPKGDIAAFLLPILSDDAAFSEFVKLFWYRYRTVEEIAEAMQLGVRQFSEKFKASFGCPPYRWMKERRAQVVYQQLITTKKPIKQVAMENGFGDITQFAKFCKKELGRSATEIKEDKSL